MKSSEWQLFTIGVYGKTEDEFYGALVEARVQILVDVRRRRGMRGAQYAFVNSNYLQNKLLQLDIAYLHAVEYSPTEELRDIQKQQDVEDKVQKRKRTTMSLEFAEVYNRLILGENPVGELMNDVKSVVADERPRLCLFCVEADPRACHRSLIAEALREEYDVEVLDL